MSVTSEPKSREAGWGETLKVVVQALVLALLVRTFVFQPFSIPSGSMKSTLLIGDYLFVSKFSYGYSRYSFPFGLVPFSGRIFASEPKRGDVVVFKLPKDNETDYIKRLIGLPGDRVQMKRGLLFINGEAVKVEPMDYFIDTDFYGARQKVKALRETLPGGVVHTILKRDDEGPANNTPEFLVPAGHYFMMGDNRDNSLDSRFADGVGFVPFENFEGKAQMIFFSIGEDSAAWQIWNWPWDVRWSRLFGRL
ncbi:signal peptidase I [Siculibacillus lacustris]|uniref:Signal peptidase I n=1 Tax=Siculibacillus lacustris TaxID=1549641 RepID=A0A4Q9VUD1_9HYPH|nr:signal peptidase I [Siculibacillus lacustris]TBW39743.1 signal peptidase I [Siculibacillus lacustris]